MNPDRTVVLEITRIEAMHLAGLVTQFGELLEATTDAAADPAVARLVPDAYADDAEASREFRDVTEGDLLARRRDDAARVLASLAPALSDDATAEQVDPDALTAAVTLVLDAETVQAWLRALAAIRLVLAERLGIESEDDHDEEDPRFGVYEWLAYRLDGLVNAISND